MTETSRAAGPGRQGEVVVHVNASRAYDVHVGRDLLSRTGALVREASAGLDGTCLLVSDEHVGPLYASTVGDSLREAGFEVHYVQLPAGERTKCLASYGRLLDAAAEARLTRAGLVVALGGGVIGDLAGFTAATYMRGCHLVQVATSLLAMVDSSVGGKTAIDLDAGKNLAGAFYQPDLVICDLDCLMTLPDTYRSDGMGEVVKYGIMADPELFGWLESPLAGQEERVVARCVSIKRDVVQADEREAGLRKLLNLGHTVGHAIELLGDYRVPHGHAVAAGCAIMARACHARGMCPDKDLARIEGMLRVHGLPTGTSRSPAEICEAATHDKKRTGDHIDIVTVEGIGRSSVRRVSIEEFAEFVDAGCGAPGAIAAEGCALLDEEQNTDGRDCR